MFEFFFTQLINKLITSSLHNIYIYMDANECKYNNIIVVIDRKN
jgi:hypothetical protein